MTKQLFRLILLLLGLWLIWDWLSHLVAEILWFQEVGYLATFLKRLQTQLGLGIVVWSISAGFLFSNLLLANQLKYSQENPDYQISGTRNSIVQTGVKTRYKLTQNATEANDPLRLRGSRSFPRRSSRRVLPLASQFSPTKGNSLNTVSV